MLKPTQIQDPKAEASRCFKGSQRKPHTVFSAGLSLSLACLGLAVTQSAEAFCGFYAGKADASLFNEASQVIMVRDGQRTVLSLLNDYKGPLKEFALVIPTPVALKQGQVRIAEKLSFERLDAYSSPRLAEYFDNDPCQFHFDWGREFYPTRAFAPPPHAAPATARADSGARAKALGVTVEAQYTLEEYDIVSLSAKQSDGLEVWLRENGYKIPKGAAAAFKPYINQGMKFFVAKVNLKEQGKTGYTYLRPLQFAFESEKFMLPIRLGMLNAAPDKAQDLIIYMLTRNGRTESSNYRTVKLPSNVNLPPAIKPRFQEFYKAMFDSHAVKEDHRVVFTEYFWDMAWCDPCAANPLSASELRNAGVFWVNGDAKQGFAPNGGAQPVVLTRMHVRYTPNSFPEDLMFTQTQDRQNWQTRYVVQHPFKGSSEQCVSTLGNNDCEKICGERIKNLYSVEPQLQRDWQKSTGRYGGRNQEALLSECMVACDNGKRLTLDRVNRYYQTDLPSRLSSEKQTLARLTGWGMAEIDKLPSVVK